MFVRIDWIGKAPNAQGRLMVLDLSNSRVSMFSFVNGEGTHIHLDNVWSLFRDGEKTPIPT